MENFTGLLYNSGTTQEGLVYKNGFGSVYALSGANVGDRGMIISQGFNETISETEGFIFWLRFDVLNISNTVNNGNFCSFFSSDSISTSPTTSAFTVGVNASGNGPGFTNFYLGNNQNANAYIIPYRSTIFNDSNSSNRINPKATTGETRYSLLVYKDKAKNFTDFSAFTTYYNNFKTVHGSNGYSNPKINVNTMRCFWKGGFVGAAEAIFYDMNIYNMGMARTSMTPAEFDLFANKMYKYDNYWHLFEGETDTPNIKQSDILFYTPMYQKFGGTSSSSTINLMYPKSTTKYFYTTTNQIPDGFGGTSRLNMTLGRLNRWRKPYSPFDPYI